MEVTDGRDVLDEPQLIEAILDLRRQGRVGAIPIRLPLESERLQRRGELGPRQALGEGREPGQIVELGCRARQEVVSQESLGLLIAVATEDEHPARTGVHAEVRDDLGGPITGSVGRPVTQDLVPRPQAEPVTGGDQHRLPDHLPVEQELHRALEVVEVVRVRRPPQSDDRPHLVTPPGREHHEPTPDRVIGVSQTIWVSG